MYTHNNPVPHRAHKKSTTGCRACKLRKVKCDEKRPVCGKCSIHFSNIAACDYNSIAKARAKPTKPTTSTTTSSSPSDTSSTRQPVINPVSSKTSDKTRSSRTSLCRSSEDAEKEARCGDFSSPCLHPAFTGMVLDAVDVCRICGNQRRQSKDVGGDSPVLSDSKLMSGSVDPFSILPAESSPRVHALTHHWNNTLALFPTKIHSQYCTNPTWMAQAVNNETFFNATLYVSSVHDAGLRGKRGTSESLYYKAQTIKLLNKSLRDSEAAVSDETLAAVLLLTHVVSLIGEPNEAEIHMNGLRQMMVLRGGIQHYTLDGVFLHMLRIVNHLTAVITESPTIIPPSGMPYKPSTKFSYSCSPTNSPLLKPFAVSIGFHPTVVDLLHDMEYLYFVVDAFTMKLLPEFRGAFEEVVRCIEGLRVMDEEREREWVVQRLKRWGEGEVREVGVKRQHAKVAIV